MTRKITYNVALIKHGLASELKLGNLDARRDWGYAGDYVEAMWLMLQQDNPDDFVISTDQTHSVREFVEEAFARADLDYKKYVKLDEKFYRPAEVDLLIGDSKKARGKLGWTPKTDFKKLVDMMVDADLNLYPSKKHNEAIEMRVLITGAQGFIGSHLSRFLIQLGAQITAPTLEQVNLLDRSSINAAIGGLAFDYVFHLAGISHVPTAEKSPEVARQTNVKGTENLLDSLRSSSPDAEFIFTSTAQVYRAPHGDEIEKGVIFFEDREIAPQNTYAQTKYEAERRIEHATQDGLSATVLRLFNHTHRSQAPDFFLPHLYSTLTKAKPGEKQTVPVGNLDLNRDIGLITDLLAAFAAVMKLDRGRSRFRIFNICSGHEKNLRKTAEILAEKMNVRADFQTDPSRVRAGEPRTIRGSCEKLMRVSDWKPECRTEEDLIEGFLA